MTVEQTDITVEQALKELREMFPRNRTRSITHRDGAMNGVWVYASGDCRGFGSTLEEAMTQVRAWKEQNG